MQRINIGIIGTSRMAQNMLHAMRLQKQVNVISVFGHSLERVNQFAADNNIPNAYNKLDALLNETLLNAVYIASANQHHTEQVIQALAAGKAVLCEKPIATSTNEIKKIQAEVKKSNGLCMEGMWTHFLPTYAKLFTLNHGASLGKVKSFYADFGYPTTEEAFPALFSGGLGGGVLLDRGVYPIALAIKLLGNVEQVASQIQYNSAGADTHAHILLKHQGGAYSQLAVSAEVLLQNRAVLSWSHGSVTLEPPLLGSEMLQHSQMSPLTSVTTSATLSVKQKLQNSSLIRRLKSMASIRNKKFVSYGHNQYGPMLAHFCDLINKGATESDVVPLSLSYETMRVIEMIKEG